jgi:hypothetical protein
MIMGARSKLFTKFLSVLLSVLVIYIPTIAYAGQQDPDDSLAVNGRLMVLGKGQTAPHGMESCLISAQQPSSSLMQSLHKRKFDLELKYQKSILTSEFQLKLGLLQAKHDALSERTDSLLKIKDSRDRPASGVGKEKSQ